MKFRETSLEGAWLVEPEEAADHRGWFARVRCEEEFKRRGLEPRFVQTSISHNHTRGVLRGLHVQVPPAAEVKLVRCIAGAVQDVILDLRPESSTFTEHFSVELSASNRLALYVPRGLAHGFQTLEDNTQLLYEISAFYSPEHARGVRWDDPAFGISWPIGNPVLLDRDRDYPDFDMRILT